jgi:hypothetical protein
MPRKFQLLLLPEGPESVTLGQKYFPCEEINFLGNL